MPHVEITHAENLIMRDILLHELTRQLDSQMALTKIFAPIYLSLIKKLERAANCEKDRPCNLRI